MTVRVAKVAVEDHPFFVVRDLAVPFIGGADFLSHLDTQTWDWQQSALVIKGQRLSLGSMYRTSRKLDAPRKEVPSCRVFVKEAVKIRSGVEALVTCTILKVKSDKEYLLEPARPVEEYPVRSMCGLLRSTAGRVTVRLVKVGTTEEVIKQGKEIGIAFPEFQTAINLKHQAALISGRIRCLLSLPARLGRIAAPVVGKIAAGSMKLPGKSRPRWYVCWSGTFRKCLQIWAYVTPPQSHYWQVPRTQSTPPNRYLRIRLLRHCLRLDNSHGKEGENAGRSNTTSWHPFFSRFHQVRHLYSTLPRGRECLPGSPQARRLCLTPC